MMLCYAKLCVLFTVSEDAKLPLERFYGHDFRVLHLSMNLPTLLLSSFKATEDGYYTHACALSRE